MPSVHNKVVLITGGARGIGAATARALSARGAELVLVDVDEAPLQEIGRELDAVTVTADVRHLAEMEAAVAAGIERFGRIDLVLANAGIASYGSVLAVDPETFKRVVDINLLGVFHTARAALPALIESKGYILVVSSLAAFAACPGLTSYNASKAGAEHFASALRLEVAHQGVGVGSAHMAWIDTPLVQDAKADLSAFGDLLAVMPGPLGKTSSVQACVDAFVAGLEGRKRRVNVPGWVGPIGWLKAVVTSRVGDRRTLKHVPRILPKMDREVAALGRSTSARNKMQ
ncbi:SDR family oxidoreductase [Rhodococcoides trifolii]|nr:SDR family oxidoreductase [Rhodococcus trifolii]